MEVFFGLYKGSLACACIFLLSARTFERTKMFLRNYLRRLAQEIGRRKAERLDSEFAPLDHKTVFSKIYGQGVWGKKFGQNFYSGPGSHDQTLVAPYVKSVKEFFAQLSLKPSVVDLGCGDFNVGQQLRDFCEAYIACDVVPELVRHNAEKFAAFNVDFRCVDMIEGVLPKADVIFIREVLQHLSNEMITKVLAKLPLSCKYLILTEDIPAQDGFLPNLDKPTGPGTRTQFGSGVVVDAPPFNLKSMSKQIICELQRENSRLRTVVYEFK